MTIGAQITIITIMFIFLFLVLHSTIQGIARYKLNKSAYKKKKKGMSFIQWFLFSKFKEEIPRGWVIFFITYCLIHVVAVITCIFIYIFDKELSFSLGRIIALCAFYGNSFLYIIYFILFYSRDPGMGARYDRWFKKRGNPPKE